MSKNFVVSLPRWSRFRFCTVEALCRDALSHSTPPLLFFVPHSRGALWKECSRPAVMQKVRETAQHPPHPSSEEEAAASLSRFAILSASSSEDSRCCPDHRLFYTPAPHVAQTCLQLFFLRTLPQRVLAGLAHMDFARAKPRQHCRTPYAAQFVQRLSLLLRRTTAQTAQLLAVTPLASNKQGY